MTGGYHRRAVLAGTVGVVGALAGCGGRDEGETGTDTRGTQTEDDVGPTDAESGPVEGDLDLREANVVGVEVSVSGSASYRFDVTLYHDDAGEEGYANWWQVESLDGERLGRRDLTHAHGTTRFTRSTTVEVSEGTTCVVVRGHDETHGYGGRAALVDVERGDTVGVDQGSEPGEFADADCP